MPMLRQAPAPLINNPGRLANVLSALTKEKVNLLAVAVMDSGERSKLRFIPDDPTLAASALETINVPFETTDVLLVEMANQPGSFNRVCERLAAEHLNIDYAYTSVAGGKGKGGGPLAVIKVNNLAKAQKILVENGGPRTRSKRPGRRPVHAR